MRLRTARVFLDIEILFKKRNLIIKRKSILLDIEMELNTKVYRS